ncbi:hypothetical protein ACHAXR_000223, partial [Thalassiosira sp. AJA248-18]
PKTRRQLRQDELHSRSVTRHPTISPSPTQSRCAYIAHHGSSHVRSHAANEPRRGTETATAASFIEDAPPKTRRKLRQDELLSLGVTRHPTISPSPTQSRYPSTSPTSLPSNMHSSLPSELPSSRPTVEPSLTPSLSPTFQPSKSPSFGPTLFPSSLPSSLPSREPTSRPTEMPSFHP